MKWGIRGAHLNIIIDGTDNGYLLLVIFSFDSIVIAPISPLSFLNNSEGVWMGVMAY